MVIGDISKRWLMFLTIVSFSSSSSFPVFHLNCGLHNFSPSTFATFRMKIICTFSTSYEKCFGVRNTYHLQTSLHTFSGFLTHQVLWVLLQVLELNSTGLKPINLWKQVSESSIKIYQRCVFFQPRCLNMTAWQQSMM